MSGGPSIGSAGASDSATVPLTAPVGWVESTFGARLVPAAGHSLDELVVLGLRRNPRRAHLLVSTVLGKHIPTPPARVRDAADELGARVVGLLGNEDAARSVVVGFAETATGLGHCVTEAISASCYLHSTRRNLADAVTHGTFEEGHSHATTHLLQPQDPHLLANPDAALVLVDDEISTGNTALAAIGALHARWPRSQYVVAALLDMRSETDRARTQTVADGLGATIRYVSLSRGSTILPDGFSAAVCELAPGALNPTCGESGGIVGGRWRSVRIPWPATVPDGGRHGWRRSDASAFHRAVDQAADVVAEATMRRYPSGISGETPLVVVGHEELMYLPLCLAERLAARWPAADVRFQTTTRSPAHVVDMAGYPLRRGFEFIAPEQDSSGATRYVYNLGDTDAPSTVVLVLDDPADTPELRAPGGLLDVLTAAGHEVLLAIVPATRQSVPATRQSGESS